MSPFLGVAQVWQSQRYSFLTSDLCWVSAAVSHWAGSDDKQMLPLPRKRRISVSDCERTPRCRRCCACHEICKPSPKRCACHAKRGPQPRARQHPVPLDSYLDSYQNDARATQTCAQMQEMPKCCACHNISPSRQLPNATHATQTYTGNIQPL